MLPTYFSSAPKFPYCPGTPSRIDRHLPDLARPELAPAIKFPVENEPAADARAEGHANDVHAHRGPPRKATPHKSSRWRRCRSRPGARSTPRATSSGRHPPSRGRWTARARARERCRPSRASPPRAHKPSDVFSRNSCAASTTAASKRLSHWRDSGSESAPANSMIFPSSTTPGFTLVPPKSIPIAVFFMNVLPNEKRDYR